VNFILCYIYFKINIIIDIYDIYFDCVAIISARIKKTFINLLFTNLFIVVISVDSII